MALLNKVRHKFGHRWMPFFLPVIASLLFVLLTVLLVPDNFSSRSEDSGSKDSLPSPDGSATGPGDAAARLARRRAPRATGRALPPPGGPGVTAPGPVPVAPAPIAPASPDGAD